MNPETLKYLQQDDIGKVIAKGLAHLYTNKPQRPINNLAQWLKTYSKNQKQLAAVVNVQKNRETSLKILESNRKLEEIEKMEKDKVVSDRQRKIQNFKNQLLAHDYQQQMLEEAFPEFVQKQTQITGAYVGYLNHPPRQVTQQDTDEQAHLNTAVDKLINYIGSSQSHKALMRGKTLGLNEGVTGKVFSLADQQPPVMNEEGQEVPQPAKQKFIYIPNVVKNETMHYFRIPKLGSYLSVPLVYNCYLTEKIFDAGLQAKNKYLSELDEFNQKKQEQLDELTPQKEQLQKKIGQLKQKNAEDPNLETLNTELKEINEKIQAKNAQKLEQPVPELPVDKQSYAFCVDNLGKDKELSKQDIDLIVELVEYFTKTIEEKQHDLLVKDVERHVKLIKQLGKQPQAFKEELQKGIEFDEQQTKEINDIQDQNLKAYKTQQKQFNKLKACIKQNQTYLNSFVKLKEYRVVKYRDLIQSILFFLCKTKAEVNVPKRACLNWKQVKCQQIDKETFNKVLDYVVQGAKTTNFNFYSKTPFLTEVFEKFDESQIFGYNVGLGALLKFIKAALKHRNSNVELRRAQKEAERNKRESIIADNERIETEKAAELEKHKAALAPEDVEGFNEEEWCKAYLETHKLTDVPEEVVDDVDNDM